LATRCEIIECLKENDFQRLLDLAEAMTGIFRILISLTYDREDVLSWRAMEAIGIIAGKRAKADPSGVRCLVQRILWMMREESGNNPWSAPDTLGEIVRNSPDEFSDIAPIIVSFHDEEFLRRGVLRAIVRVSEIRPDLMESASSIIGQYLKDPDAFARLYALIAAGNLSLKELLPDVEALKQDAAEVKIYRHRNLERAVLATAACETVIILSAEGK
jgi:hypothetical protein